MGQPPFQEFAPYAAHVLAVEVFFFLAVGANLIGTSDPKNRVDIAYLHYLPFCMVFVSSDNLHARCAPLFMGEDQSFVDGAAMKLDLAKLDAHYSKLPDEVKDRGVMSFAPCPPLEGGFLTSDLWDKHLPSWRKQAERPSKLSEEAVQKIQKKMKEMVEAAESSSVGTQPSDVSNATQTVIRRRVPTRKGKWRMVPPEVEEEAGKE